MDGMSGLTPLPGWRGGDANAAYLDKTLHHKGLDTAFDEQVRPADLRRLWSKAIMTTLQLAVFLLPFVLIGGVGSAGSWITFGVLVSVLFVVVLLAARSIEPIGEWQVLLIDRCDRATDVYSQIRGTLRERQSPLTVQHHRLWLPGRRASYNRLRLSEGPYEAYVSVFPYGTSLYLGWTMWRSRPGHVMIRHFLADAVRGMAGQNGYEARMMRSERPRAMREAVHLACREGLYVGFENRSVDEAFGFPEGLPEIQDSPQPAAYRRYFDMVAGFWRGGLAREPESALPRAAPVAAVPVGGVTTAEPAEPPQPSPPGSRSTDAR